MKNICDLALNITEEEYRKMPELSYSTLAKYERGGFDSLETLFDRVESPSLLFGSCVDTLITGSQEEFDNLYLVADFPDIPDSIITIVKYLHKEYSNNHRSLESISKEDVFMAAELYKYQLNWKPETRVKVIKEKGSEYYNLLSLAENKTIVSNTVYADILAAVDVLKNSEATSYYFRSNNPFEPLERHYQLKFKAKFEGIGYRIMMDELIVNHEEKWILPIDLKTSSKPEYNFHKSFIEWLYPLQGILYTAVLKKVIEKDEYFKNFTILPYKFIVVNKHSLNPLVWEFKENHTTKDLVYGKNKNIIIRHPFTIGKELTYYLSSTTKVPIGIKLNESNDLKEWLDKL